MLYEVITDEAELTPRLTRRDAGSDDFDFLEVSFDSFHDHETSYQFQVNPSGAYRDVVAGGGGGGGGGGGRGGGRGDSSWDPVWTRGVQVTEEGWFAEMRIPFSQLRFGRDERQTWGVQVERTINRIQENATFPFIV